jgi:membrane fusion protein (multidrug efflux system)
LRQHIMKGKIALAILIVLAVAGGLGATKSLQIKTMMAAVKLMPQPSETVSSFVVREEQWQDTLEAVGTITAVQGVTVTPELPGMVSEISFESGSVVAKGDVLARLDTASEQAQLRAVEAQLELARINLDRERTLRKENMVSQSDLDSAEATVKQLQANADAIRTTIDKKTIRAPFAGKLGIRAINLGQYLEAGKPIVSLQSLEPVYADFSLPQQDISRLTNGMPVRLSLDAYPGRKFEGKLTAINPDLDSSTRSVGIQATFDNAERLLRPGMFARVQVLLPQHQKSLVIPLTSVLNNPYGDSVYVIEESTEGGTQHLAVRQQFIQVGRTRGDFVSVTSGLKPGDKIASSGVFKLRNGMAVTENNSLVPPASETPKPADS